MSLSSSPPVAGVWVSAYTWLALWLSLLSTCSLVCGERIHLIGSMTLSSCSWCVVSAYTRLSLWLSLLSTCSWCVVSTYTWLSLWLSLLSTCSWCVVSAYTWLSLCLSLSSPPVAGVWWAHTLDWLFVSLSSPPVAGVWWAHTLDWLYDSLSSPPVAGVWRAHWRCYVVAAFASSKWMLHTGGGWGETTTRMILKCFGCTTKHKKALYKYIIHSFITNQMHYYYCYYLNNAKKHYCNAKKIIK